MHVSAEGGGKKRKERKERKERWHFYANPFLSFTPRGKEGRSGGGGKKREKPTLFLAIYLKMFFFFTQRSFLALQSKGERKDINKSFKEKKCVFFCVAFLLATLRRGREGRSMHHVEGGEIQSTFATGTGGRRSGCQRGGGECGLLSQPTTTRS